MPAPPARHALQPWAAVDIGQVDHGVLAVELDAGWYHGRADACLQRHGLQQSISW